MSDLINLVNLVNYNVLVNDLIKIMRKFCRN